MPRKTLSGQSRLRLASGQAKQEGRVEAPRGASWPLLPKGGDLFYCCPDNPELQIPQSECLCSGAGSHAECPVPSHRASYRKANK